MENNQKQNYISLFEAAKLCPYSEPYLRLRSRQGKLKSIKLGKKWMTTEEWLNEYVARVQEWNEKIAVKRGGAVELAKEEPPIAASVVLQQSVLPPQTLAQPVSLPKNDTLYGRRSAEGGYNPFFKWKIIQTAEFAESMGKNDGSAIPFAGQILPAPKPKNVSQNNGRSYESMGALFSGIAAALALLIMAVGGGPMFKKMYFPLDADTGQARIDRSIMPANYATDGSMAPVTDSLVAENKTNSHNILRQGSLSELVEFLDGFLTDTFNLRRR